MTLPIPRPNIRRKILVSTPEIDDALAAAYAKGIVPGKTLPALQRRFARPHQWLKRRAAKIGLAVPRLKYPDWSDAEIEALADLAHYCPTVIARKLVDRGFVRRSVTGISIKLKRMKIYSSTARADAGWYTASAIAQMVGKDRKAVTKWIETGWLNAHRAGTARTEQQHGDMWLIHERDIRAMVRKHAETIELGRWDRRFLADVLIDPKPKTPTPLFQEAP